VYLLFLVVAIYAAIMVRFFMLSGDNDTDLGMINSSNGFKKESFQTAEAFTINNNYRDPFLKIQRIAAPRAPKNSSPVIKKKVEKDSIVFPEVIYKGLVSDAKGGRKPIFALEINNREYVVTQGSVQDEIEILNGTEEEITLRFNQKEKVIKIN